MERETRRLQARARRDLEHGAAARLSQAHYWRTLISGLADQARRIRICDSNALLHVLPNLSLNGDADCASDSLAIFLPGAATTHVLAGLPRWVYEQISSQGPLSDADLIAQATAGTGAAFDPTVFAAAIDTLLDAGLAQSAA